MIEKPPKHLRPATKAWFSSVLAEYSLEPHHVRLLTLAAESWDRETLNVPVKRRTNKRREQLCEDADRWLRGEPCGFFEFKDAHELSALWAEYGDPKVAVWDEGARKPRARKEAVN